MRNSHSPLDLYSPLSQILTVSLSPWFATIVVTPEFEFLAWSIEFVYGGVGIFGMRCVGGCISFLRSLCCLSWRRSISVACCVYCENSNWSAKS